MKTYRRTDGFEVHDANNRSIEWVKKEFGGEFVEISHPTMTTSKKRIIAIDAELERIDIKSIRAIRTNDNAKMAEWESKAQTLRTERATLV